jgi:tetratricopeptide (TPR) repeat protein
VPPDLEKTLKQRLDDCWSLGRSGKSTEGLVEAQLLLIEAREANDPERIAQANRCIGWFCLQLGYANDGLEAAGQAQNYYAGTENPWGHGLSSAVYSWLLLELGLSDLSFESASQATVIAANTDDRALNAFALNCKAIALTVCREHQLARPVLADALELAEKAGDPSTLALTLVNTGYATTCHGFLAGSNGDRDMAQTLFRKAMAANDRSIGIARESGDLWNLRTGLCNGAETYAVLGDIELAQHYLQEWSELPGQIGPREQIHYLYTKGDIYSRLGDDEQAFGVYQAARRLASNSGQLEQKVNTLRRLADLKAKLGDYEEAFALHREFHDAYVS